jgi:hypothetical protein
MDEDPSIHDVGGTVDSHGIDHPGGKPPAPRRVSRS